MAHATYSRDDLAVLQQLFLRLGHHDEINNCPSKYKKVKEKECGEWEGDG
jgi:hypothetical protein